MRTFILILSTLVFVSCKNKAEKKEKESDPVSTTKEVRAKRTISEVPISKSLLYGYYSGFFNASVYDSNKKPSYSNKITISIDSIHQDEIYGHSVVAGNSRPFKGEIWSADGVYNALVSEPGDDQYDGVFNFKLNPLSKSINGTWIANDKNLAVTERKYKLYEKTFSYDPDRKLFELGNREEDEEAYYGNVFAELYNSDNSEIDGPESEYATIQAIKINASNTELTNADLENLYKGDLEIIRNAIYARHGYSFKNRRMRYFFDSRIDWYIPISTDIRSELTDLEKKNIELIKRYEQHAEKYYDYFGR